jgi:pimeloyl-ACP methyl ester carboxylesterase
VIIDQLRAVLTAAGMPPPYVLVGTSIGGLYVNLYARRFPQEVAGVVLLASNHPDDDLLERVMRFIPRSPARAGMGLSSGSSRRNAEERFLPQTATEIAQATAFPDVPLTVVSSRIAAGPTTSPAQAATYVAGRSSWPRCPPRGRHITTSKASFIPQISDPAVVVRIIRDIVNEGST